jgi:Kef-type K+ transport system membrane component KefB
MLLLAQLVHVEKPEGPALPFLVLFVVIVLGPLIIERFRVPGIIGLLLGGLLIGPHGLGIVGSGNTTIPDFGKIGLLYLMFVAGLELDLRLVNAHRRDTLIYSALTFSLPMLAGTFAGFAIGFSGLAAVLLGSLLASHTLVVYPLIKDMGRGHDKAVATGVGATVITDTLTLIVLAAVSGLTVGQADGFDIASQIVIGLIVLGFGCFFVLPRLARLFLGRFGMTRATRYGVALVAMLGAATLAEAFGIEGIVGAFFAGLALNRLVPNEGDLMSRIEFFGGAVFIPVFLVSVGLIIDPSVMADPETLRLAAIFIAACFGGKLAAALLTRPLLHYRWPEIGVLFALTIPQAAATLAATIVGFDIGLFGTDVVNAVLVLIAVSLIVSAIIAPVFARRLDVSMPDPHDIGRRVLLVMEPEHPLRRAVAELACRLAKSDDGIVLPVVVASEHDQLNRSLRKKTETTLLLLGVDHPIEEFVDQNLAEGVLHAARSFRCTSVVVDDPSDAICDACGGCHPEQPVLFVGSLRVDRIGQSPIDCDDGANLAMRNLTARLGNGSVASSDGAGRLIMREAGSASGEGVSNDSALGVVRVLTAAGADPQDSQD